MKRLRASLALAAGLALATSMTAAAASPTKISDNKVVSAYTGPTVDTSTALVQLNGDPLATYVKTKPAHGKKVDLNSSTTKAYRAQLSALRNDFKQWLQVNAPKAKITGSWDLALNAVSVQLNGTTLTKLAAAPQAKHVEYVGLYHPDVADPDLSLISAQAAWTRIGGVANAGRGVQVAIVDTGIDIRNPCFSDAGFPATTQLGDPAYTNNKVIVAKVFNNKIASRHYTAQALQEHGTHVAGTVACDYNTAATVDGASIPYGISGVAPAAQLGSYNIFPGDVVDARSEDILNALDAAYADGMDVANMSLGGGAHGVKDLLTMAVDNFDQANMVVAVAAGNSGDGENEDHPFFAPGHFTVESPGSAARALTAGAYSVGHQVASVVAQGGNFYASADGDYAVPTTDLTGPTVEALAGSPVALVGGHSDGCDPYPAAVPAGSIVLIARGVCDFAVKVHNAQVAGAAGVIIVNRDPTPIPMADTPALGNTIPAVMVGHADGLALFGNIPMAATITAPLYVSKDIPATAAVAPAALVQADFSSQGPTDVDFRVKPDVMAPGVNVLSSLPNEFCDAPPCFAFFQGTSMATPHLAGSAAVVLGANPTWDAWQVRSVIVNTADQGRVLSATNGTTVVTDVNIVGAGSENLDKALGAWVALDPVSVSFGAVPSGSGTTQTYAVTIKNLKNFAYDYGLTITANTGGGVTYSAPSHILLAAGATGTFNVTMTSAKGSTGGGHQAQLNVTGTTATYAHMVLYALIK